MLNKEEMDDLHVKLISLPTNGHGFTLIDCSPFPKDTHKDIIYEWVCKQRKIHKLPLILQPSVPVKFSGKAMNTIWYK